jgi:hypothetical protein
VGQQTYLMQENIMKHGPGFLMVVLLFSALFAACSGGGGGVVQGGQTPTLTSIAIAPASPAMAPGTTTQLFAIGTYSNNLKQYITTSATWTSSDPTIANVGNVGGSKGLVTATTTTGTTIITAVLSGITGSVTLTTAHVASISVTPPAPQSIAPTTSMQFTATGTLSDGNSTKQNLTTFATWTSADPGIADVSTTPGSNGIATAISAGTATITATYDGRTGSAAFKSSLLASIALAPTGTSIAKGTTKQFTATGTLADSVQQVLTTYATWSTSTPGVATISNTAGSKGLATAVSEGTTTITAEFLSITSSQATLTVTPAFLNAITVSPVNPSIVLGTTKQFIATGTFTDLTTQDISSSATWNSSNTSVSTISNTPGSKGLATSKAVGSTTITAISGGISGSTSLTVTQAVLESIEITTDTAVLNACSGPFSTEFTATGRYSDNTLQDLTTSVSWNSSNPNVATISNTPGSLGLATVSSFTGGTDITATVSGITSNTTTITVVCF